jgi:radical SAM superfamily enzyme YgiQ (UPF0313 family)
LIPELDVLPFPDKEIYYSRYPIFKNGYLIATSRGCPFKCTYCCNNIYYHLYSNASRIVRKRSISNVITELELAKSKYGPKFIHFVDDVFNYDQKWLFEFLAIYKDMIGLPFSCYLFPDFVDVQMAEALKESGCFKIQMGVQVVSDDKKKNVLKRSSSQEKIGEAIELLKKKKIYLVCDSIFGFPDETEDELLEKLRERLEWSKRWRKREE